MTASPTLTLHQLEEALTVLRRQGVRLYTDVAGGGFTVEFFPREPDIEVSKTSKPELCKCGHEAFKHDAAGLCVEGCAEDACRPKETK